MTPSGFSVSAQASGCCLIVSIAGEMDLSSIPAFEAELAKVELFGSVRHVVFTCPNLTFADSTALGAMLGIAVGQEDGAAIVGAGHQVERVLQVTGLTGMLPMFASFDDALSHLHTPAA